MVWEAGPRKGVRMVLPSDPAIPDDSSPVNNFVASLQEIHDLSLVLFSQLALQALLFFEQPQKLLDLFLLRNWVIRNEVKVSRRVLRILFVCLHCGLGPDFAQLLLFFWHFCLHLVCPRLECVNCFSASGLFLLEVYDIFCRDSGLVNCRARPLRSLLVFLSLNFFLLNL